MMKNRNFQDDTKLCHAGRDPARDHGAVNPPVYHVSTVLYESLAEMKSRSKPMQKGIMQYGRMGTPTTFALEEAVAELDGGYGAIAVPSGMAAIAGALLALVKTGDHVLVVDSVYHRTREFCDHTLSRFGMEVTYYDPRLGADIAALIRPNTRAVYTESPGSQTFEIQDIPAISEAAHRAGATVLMDNTWASPLLCKPLALGADVVIHAGTKYIVGHSDAMLGLISTGPELYETIRESNQFLGYGVGPDDIYLGLRGLRTLGVRLARHQENGLRLAEWFQGRPEVERVLHPALPDHPDHALWQRDFSGASGLFGVILKPQSAAAVTAMMDGMDLFGMGFSWGGYESLLVPIDPPPERSATAWQTSGPLLRVHAGLEDAGDLIEDLAAGFDRLNAAAP